MSAERETPRLVTIEYFCKEMLGLKSRQWYYTRLHDPELPKRVYFGNRAFLVHDDCVAYMKRRIAEARGEPEGADKVKRHPGRPAAPVKRRAS